MNVSQFISKWSRSELKERAGSQEHFLDLCELVEHPKPADSDPGGESFTFERGASKLDGGDGWADVWKREFFAWEYKGKHANLDTAYKQLQQYRDALENPPLLVVSDMDRIVIRTNFTNTPVQKYEIALNDLRNPVNLQVLRDLFYCPENLKPGRIREIITKDAAARIAEIAQALRDRKVDPHQAARFIDRIVFCLFAEDVALLPESAFTRILQKSASKPSLFTQFVGPLFEAMATGGIFGIEEILHFNGNLFNDAEVLALNYEEIKRIEKAASLDWSAVDPSIFGTLFERGLDPAKRSQIGAHYTSREDIETLVEPVVMQPLRREWHDAREHAEAILRDVDSQNASAATKTRAKANKVLDEFISRLSTVKVLDPACGSGNFLYVTLQELLHLEKEVIDYALERQLGVRLPKVSPEQLYGIEINDYAHELAQMTVWIGYLQWIHDHGYPNTERPILRCMDNIKRMDAIIDFSDPANPKEPEWPEVDFIVGNPPFLGDKLMRGASGDEYVDGLRAFYGDRIPGGSDLCCYWFEKARKQIEDGRCERAGLLATQGIRGGANRVSLKRIKESGDIFFAESDRPWILDGANVHVSMVGFDDGSEDARYLDGEDVESIHPNLTAVADVTQAALLLANLRVGFLGSCKGGDFDIDEEEALRLVAASGNPNGRPNSDVVRPVFNSEDLLQNRIQRWIVDNADLPLREAASYELPHRIVETRVKPARDANRDRWLRENWWRPQRMRPLMRSSIVALRRFLVTTTTSKHRLFVWLAAPSLPDHQLIVFARSDDYFFGVLHSRLHEAWARATGTQVRERESGFRYTPTTCFETFPFPEPTPDQEAAIGEAARELNELREAWLNPPEWTREEILEFPGSVDGPWARYVHAPDNRGIGTVRYPRIVAKDPDCAALLAKRTLTNLYNERPTWLDLAHKKLDEAVFAAYGWDPAMTDDDILARLLELNLSRAAAEADA